MYYQSFSKICLILFVFLTGCGWKPKGTHYYEHYRYLSTHRPPKQEMIEEDFFLVVIACARHLDYYNSQQFLKTLVKHPGDGCKLCDLGHTWIYLKGKMDEEDVYIHGGHTGDFGVLQPHYFDGLLDLAAYADPNPIRILWKPMYDGYFIPTCDEYEATYAAKFSLTEAGFFRALRFLQTYDYEYYSLYDHHCSTFVTELLQEVGINLDTKISIPIMQKVRCFGKEITLWNDPMYSEIMITSPDLVEKRLVQAVENGEAEYALEWYRKRFPYRRGISYLFEDITQFPLRALRAAFIFLQ